MKDLTLAIPDDVSVMGIFYIREFSENGYMYNSADSKTFMISGVDGIDLVTGKTYTITDNDEWVEVIADSIVSEEELTERETLNQEIERLEKEIIELEKEAIEHPENITGGVPLMEGLNDVNMNN